VLFRLFFLFPDFSLARGLQEDSYNRDYLLRAPAPFKRFARVMHPTARLLHRAGRIVLMPRLFFASVAYGSRLIGPMMEERDLSPFCSVLDHGVRFWSQDSIRPRPRVAFPFSSHSESTFLPCSVASFLSERIPALGFLSSGPRRSHWSSGFLFLGFPSARDSWRNRDHCPCGRPAGLPAAISRPPQTRVVTSFYVCWSAWNFGRVGEGRFSLDGPNTKSGQSARRPAPCPIDRPVNAHD